MNFVYGLVPCLAQYLAAGQPEKRHQLTLVRQNDEEPWQLVERVWKSARNFYIFEYFKMQIAQGMGALNVHLSAHFGLQMKFNLCYVFIYMDLIAQT